MQVCDYSHIYVFARLQGSALIPMILNTELLDPRFDCDFFCVTDDGNQYERGGKIYQRPYGWNRIALKVIGKYDDDDWLGNKGMRQGSSDKEWPVSYHGTSENGGKSIADEGYDISKGSRFKYGKGIYSTPSIAVAERYAKTFQHQQEQYKVVLQNRVKEDENLNIIPANKCRDCGEYWVQSNETYTRPYGLCFKKC